MTINEREDKLKRGFQDSSRYSPNPRWDSTIIARLVNEYRSNYINFQSEICKAYWCEILGFLEEEQTQSKLHTTLIGYLSLKPVALNKLLWSQDYIERECEKTNTTWHFKEEDLQFRRYNLLLEVR